MPLPVAAWIAIAAAGAVAIGVLGRKKAPGAKGVELQPKALSYAPRFTRPPPLRISEWGVSIEQGPRLVLGPPQIPADVLAIVAARILYAGAFDEYIPDMKRIAQLGAGAEAHRGTITVRIWEGLRVGMDGISTWGEPGFDAQNLRFNAIAVAVQNELNRTDPLPSQAFRSWPMLRPALQYYIQPIDTLSPAGQWLCLRYIQLVEGVGCDLWDEIWVQGHTTREIYERSPMAVGKSPEACANLQHVRFNWLFRKLEALRNGAFTEEVFVDTLARKVLELAKQKIIIWPGGPASSPYVDWGYLIGWLVRAYGAAQSGDVEGLSDLAEEAGQKAKEWGARPPGEDYGSAEMAADLESFAGELAAGA